MTLHEDICRFLRGYGLECRTEEIEGNQVIRSGDNPAILPVSISETDPDQARIKAEATRRLVRILSQQTGAYPLIITEDRWRSQSEMMQRRLLAHLRVYVQIYARNCEVRKIDKNTAAEFLKANHSYGDATCRHRYGLYLKRYTGHTVRSDNDPDRFSEMLAEERTYNKLRTTEPSGAQKPQTGDLVAVATFSNGRKWIKGEKVIRSFEWTRYASLPGVRLSGGMGRLLKAFIEDVKPDDIMTYADLEWSEGGVYETLGFELEGMKSPVLFEVDSFKWIRSAQTGHRQGPDDGTDEKIHSIEISDSVSFDDSPESTHPANTLKEAPKRIRYFQNLGSNKYRLKLTDYQ